MLAAALIWQERLQLNLVKDVGVRRHGYARAELLVAACARGKRGIMVLPGSRHLLLRDGGVLDFR